MAKIVFFGLGNMGRPMAHNLRKAGFEVIGHDVMPNACAMFQDEGGVIADDLPQSLSQANFVISMLPAGPHVRALYEDIILGHVSAEAVLIDCSTIDVESARAVADMAQQKGLDVLDAPVSGGTVGAENGTLTFMVGGAEKAFIRAREVLEAMGKNIIHAGGAGNGQAAKICNNMMLGIQMISVAEAFNLAEALGLDAENLFNISSTSSGQCWSLTNYCPVPGLVPTAPSNRDYQPGFSANMMRKDLGLAEQSALSSHVATPLGAQALSLYKMYCAAGGGEIDFSSIIRFLRNGQTQ